MPTECLFRDDSYLKECTARVIAISDAGIILNRTVFYASSGGQPGDSGVLIDGNGAEIAIGSTVYTDPGKSEISHIPASGGVSFAVGDIVTTAIDWPKRHARMRMHTALH